MLDQTTIYSKFLSEQMEGLDEETYAERERKKRKKSGKDAPTRKKGGDGANGGDGASEELSETKKLLPMMNVEMRDYQLKGVRWLVALYQNGLNGILADQMGLGKTVQTIGFLSHLRNKGILGPYLILGPLSTLSNWINEFNRFCPEFPAVLYHGPKDARQVLDTFSSEHACSERSRAPASILSSTRAPRGRPHRRVRLRRRGAAIGGLATATASPRAPRRTPSRAFSV